MCIDQRANYFLSMVLLMYFNIFVGLDLFDFCTFIFMLYIFISSLIIWPILHFLCVSLLFKKNSCFNLVGFFVHLLSFPHNETVHIWGHALLRNWYLAPNFCLLLLPKNLEFLFSIPSFQGVLRTSHFWPVPQLVISIL